MAGERPPGSVGELPRVELLRSLTEEDAPVDARIDEPASAQLVLWKATGLENAIFGLLLLPGLVRLGVEPEAAKAHPLWDGIGLPRLSIGAVVSGWVVARVLATALICGVLALAG